MDQDIPLHAEIYLGPGDVALDGNPAHPTERGTTASPNFRPMSNVAKRSSISATAELLFVMVALCNRADHNIYGRAM